jgi:hypothetical protein
MILLRIYAAILGWVRFSILHLPFQRKELQSTIKDVISDVLDNNMLSCYQLCVGHRKSHALVLLGAILASRYFSFPCIVVGVGRGEGGGGCHVGSPICYGQWPSKI